LKYWKIICILKYYSEHTNIHIQHNFIQNYYWGDVKEGISHYYVEIYLLLILHALQVMIRYDMIMFVSIIRIYPLKAEVFCKMIYDALLMILLSLITIDKLQDFFLPEIYKIIRVLIQFVPIIYIYSYILWKQKVYCITHLYFFCVLGIFYWKKSSYFNPR